jgi:hypothetical protein
MFGYFVDRLGSIVWAICVFCAVMLPLVIWAKWGTVQIIIPDGPTLALLIIFCPSALIAIAPFAAMIWFARQQKKGNQAIRESGNYRRQA